MEGSDKTPSPEITPPQEAGYDPLRGFCLHTLVQLLRGAEKSKIQPVVQEALTAACDGDLEVQFIAELQMKHCKLQCRRPGCRVEISYWESNVLGDETFLWSHSKEEVEERGCLSQSEWREKRAGVHYPDQPIY